MTVASRPRSQQWQHSCRRPWPISVCRVVPCRAFSGRPTQGSAVTSASILASPWMSSSAASHVQPISIWHPRIGWRCGPSASQTLIRSGPPQSWLLPRRRGTMPAYRTPCDPGAPMRRCCWRCRAPRLHVSSSDFTQHSNWAAQHRASITKRQRGHCSIGFPSGARCRPTISNPVATRSARQSSGSDREGLYAWSSSSVSLKLGTNVSRK
jgi:hypothetical protein